MPSLTQEGNSWALEGAEICKHDEVETQGIVPEIVGNRVSAGAWLRWWAIPSDAGWLLILRSPVDDSGTAFLAARLMSEVAMLVESGEAQVRRHR